ncbi:endopeptidase La [Desulforhabdus amnigena]|uniref:endopeptidase La n=1 Tax=Desulforhabdus amnigena TaxID=40218 RepID=A0A9W6FRG2_9BACT|nr:endopeptidase La [Desulforhabdus amnigena]NLJ27750.1 endopeptidase La [Deltaproteobacteria bacterium]GLI32958.1 endopeptidase La [Desulforhabdus amnigena]
MVFFWKAENTENEEAQAGTDLDDLRKGIEKAKLPAPVALVVGKELERLEKMDSSNPDYTIGLNYMDYLLSLPWHSFTEDNLDLKRAENILESHHHGLRLIKERVLEYLSVRTLCSLADFQILVVDDEEIARTNLAYILKKEGYRVVTAGNGLEAVKKMKEHSFDLVLTDLKMEGMDGIQLLEYAKQQEPRPEIVLITGYATVSTAVDALQKGAAHYLPKPVDLDEIRATVRGIRDKKRHLQMTRSPVLCFAGPPGTGKTSVGCSIAEALEREFVRISLAGLRDEAELRGHRRTYVGAMPGRIINEIKRVGVKNPVFMLDEIDKIGQDFRGDPASVLLEILDPEQNQRFTDNYLDIPFDLSGVMFIATANAVDKLPEPLLDRMEVIYFPSYTAREKKMIAEQYLIPRQMREHALTRKKIEFSDGAVTKLIQDYTLEAGLRNLERQIATVCRKLARIYVQSEQDLPPLRVDESMLERLLGPRKFRHEIAVAGRQVGVTTGLVWTEFGGEIISVEAGIMNGSQQLILTGSLGSVLRESAQTALSYIRSHADIFSIDPDFFARSDIHVHIPSGAVSKDGPSAGITIVMALISLLTKRPARRDVALTGELTLSGRILPVSGIRDKLLAAQRAGVKVVILPLANEVDVQGLEADVTEGLEVVLADEVQSLVDVVFGKD